MAVSPTGWVVLGGFAAGAAYLVWSWNAAPARMPRGLTDRWVIAREGKLRAVAADVHAAIRTGVFERLRPDEEGFEARRTQACAEGLIVSCGVLSPPGAVRIQLEHRRPGDHPGLRFVVELRRVDGGVELWLRGDSPRLFGLPRGLSAVASGAVDEAVGRLGG